MFGPVFSKTGPAPARPKRATACDWSGASVRLARFEIERAETTCPGCGKTLKLRKLSPGMKGEARVSNVLPTHDA